jgi:DNA-binding GntR family transcriptional regulator
MESLLEKMSKPHDRRRYADFLLNQQFHLILYRASGWQYLTEVITRLFDQVLLFRGSIYRRFTEQEMETILSWDHFKAYHQDHLKIMERIKAGDSKGTRDAVVKNLKRGFQGLKELLAYFDNKSES